MVKFHWVKSFGEPVYSGPPPTEQPVASAGTRRVELYGSYSTKLWNTFAKYPSVTKNPLAGSSESYAAPGDSSTIWFLFGAPEGCPEAGVYELVDSVIGVVNGVQSWDSGVAAGPELVVLVLDPVDVDDADDDDDEDVVVLDPVPVVVEDWEDVVDVVVCVAKTAR
jgi:hypothetical protein